MHRLIFLEPGHFHAALTLRERHPRVDDEIVVYATQGPELDEFLELVGAFNARADRPTQWRSIVRAGERALERLLDDRAGDAVVLAGRNDTKASTMRRLHEAGLHVLADKPWITRPAALLDVTQVLSGGAVAMEIMTGRHEITSIVAERLVREPEVFGEFDTGAAEAPIRLTSVHHLEKTVNGVPLRRPVWYFDVRVQGNGLADIPTHLVAQAQRLVAARGRMPDRDATLLAARCWPTRVPLDAFRRITGVREFPPELRAVVDDGPLAYAGNAELSCSLGGVTVAIETRWDLATPPGGGDMHTAIVSGTTARVRVVQGPETGFRRRVFVEPRGEERGVGAALDRAVAAWQSGYPGVTVVPARAGFEIDIPDSLRTGHETHFPLVLDEFLRTIERAAWPDVCAADTAAKYGLLARALAFVSS